MGRIWSLFLQRKGLKVIGINYIYVNVYTLQKKQKEFYDLKKE